MKDALAASGHHHCNCWTVRRKDGISYSLTDFNEKIEIAGYPYLFVPGGFDQSARQRQTTMKDENLTLAGFLSSDLITDTDIYAGLYEDATIQHLFVDWRVPEFGPISKSDYLISGLKFTGEIWEAELTGLTSKAKPKVGYSHTRSCPHDLGESSVVSGVEMKCGVDLPSLTVFDVRVSSTITSRSDFRANINDISSGPGDDYYNLGLIVWKTGANAGVESEVQDYVEATRQITLQTSVPFDIAEDDEFDISPGCDKGISTTHGCNTKFSNSAQFGGDPFMPGTDRLFRTPSRT